MFSYVRIVSVLIVLSTFKSMSDCKLAFKLTIISFSPTPQAPPNKSVLVFIGMRPKGTLCNMSISTVILRSEVLHTFVYCFCFKRSSFVLRTFTSITDCELGFKLTIIGFSRRPKSPPTKSVLLITCRHRPKETLY